MKKTNKIIVALSIILVIATLTVNSFATITPGSFSAATVSSSSVVNFGNQIIGVVRTVGVLISIVILLVLGIKYMVGSAEEKADYKKSMIPYIVGAILIFASTTIVGIVYDMASALDK